jgi:hypothetical protein
LSAAGDGEPSAGQKGGQGTDGIPVEVFDLLREVVPRHQIRGELADGITIRPKPPAVLAAFDLPQSAAGLSSHPTVHIGVDHVFPHTARR